MFREVRYQTGEGKEVAAEMKSGSIPCIEVNDMEEFEAFTARLEPYGIKKNESIPYDKDARDRVKEPEFEFRAAFYLEGQYNSSLYLDVYFEPEIERTYDPVGEM